MRSIKTWQGIETQVRWNVGENYMKTKLANASIKEFSTAK
jgi:hypothetical protein